MKFIGVDVEAIEQASKKGEMIVVIYKDGRHFSSDTVDADDLRYYVTPRYISFMADMGRLTLTIGAKDIRAIYIVSRRITPTE